MDDGFDIQNPRSPKNYFGVEVHQLLTNLVGVMGKNTPPISKKELGNLLDPDAETRVVLHQQQSKYIYFSILIFSLGLFRAGLSCFDRAIWDYLEYYVP